MILQQAPPRRPARESREGRRRLGTCVLWGWQVGVQLTGRGLGLKNWEACSMACSHWEGWECHVGEVGGRVSSQVQPGHETVNTSLSGNQNQELATHNVG